MRKVTFFSQGFLFMLSATNLIPEEHVMVIDFHRAWLAESQKGRKEEGGISRGRDFSG